MYLRPEIGIKLLATEKLISRAVSKLDSMSKGAKMLQNYAWVAYRKDCMTKLELQETEN